MKYSFRWVTSRACSLLIVSALLVSCSSESSTPTDSETSTDTSELQRGTTLTTDEYLNPRFGYAVQIPTGLIVDSEPDNDDGLTLKSADGRAELLLYGSYNVDFLDARGLLAEEVLSLEQSGGRRTYTSLGTNSFVCSGYDQAGNIVYVRGLVGGENAIAVARWTYPSSDIAKWNKGIELVTETLHFNMSSAVPS